MSKIIQSTKRREVVAKVAPCCLQLSTLNKELFQNLVEIREQNQTSHYDDGWLSIGR